MVEELGSMDPFIRVLGVVVMASRISSRASQCTGYDLAGVARVAGDEKNIRQPKSRSATAWKGLDVWSARVVQCEAKRPGFIPPSRRHDLE